MVERQQLRHSEADPLPHCVESRFKAILEGVRCRGYLR